MAAAMKKRIETFKCAPWNELRLPMLPVGTQISFRYNGENNAEYKEMGPLIDTYSTCPRVLGEYPLPMYAADDTAMKWYTITSTHPSSQTVIQNRSRSVDVIISFVHACDAADTKGQSSVSSIDWDALICKMREVERAPKSTQHDMGACQRHRVMDRFLEECHAYGASSYNRAGVSTIPTPRNRRRPVLAIAAPRSGCGQRISIISVTNRLASIGLSPIIVDLNPSEPFLFPQGLVGVTQMEGWIHPHASIWGSLGFPFADARKAYIRWIGHPSENAAHVFGSASLVASSSSLPLSSSLVNRTDSGSVTSPPPAAAPLGSSMGTGTLGSVHEHGKGMHDYTLDELEGSDAELWKRCCASPDIESLYRRRISEACYSDSMRGDPFEFQQRRRSCGACLARQYYMEQVDTIAKCVFRRCNNNQVAMVEAKRAAIDGSDPDREDRSTTAGAAAIVAAAESPIIIRLPYMGESSTFGEVWTIARLMIVFRVTRLMAIDTGDVWLSRLRDAMHRFGYDQICRSPWLHATIIRENEDEDDTSTTALAVATNRPMVHTHRVKVVLAAPGGVSPPHESSVTASSLLESVGSKPSMPRMLAWLARETKQLQLEHVGKSDGVIEWNMEMRAAVVREAWSIYFGPPGCTAIPSTIPRGTRRLQLAKMYSDEPVVLAMPWKPRIWRLQCMPTPGWLPYVSRRDSLAFLRILAVSSSPSSTASSLASLSTAMSSAAVPPGGSRSIITTTMGANYQQLYHVLGQWQQPFKAIPHNTLVGICKWRKVAVGELDPSAHARPPYSVDYTSDGIPEECIGVGFLTCEKTLVNTGTASTDPTAMATKSTKTIETVYLHCARGIHTRLQTCSTSDDYRLVMGSLILSS